MNSPKEFSGQFAELTASRAAQKSRLRPRRTMHALESRIVFDGAAVAAVDAMAQAGGDAAIYPDSVAPVASARVEMVFVESNVADYQTLLSGVTPGAEVHVLDASQDGLAQIAGIIGGRSGIDAIHIVSHGSEGSVQLGTLNLSAQNLGDHAADLATIGGALDANADILLYGCSVAAGSDGAALVDALAQATQADLAASTDITGAAAQGGNWGLEKQVGQIDVIPGLTFDFSGYNGLLLAPTTVSTIDISADTGASSTDFITNTAAQTINGTLSAGLAMGEFVEVSLDNGATWTTAANTVGQNTWSLAGQTLTGSNTLQVRVTNAAGLSGTASTQAYVLDQAAPLATQTMGDSRLSPYPPYSTFAVTYTDTGGGIDVSTIDTSDITVTGPGGRQLAVTSAMFYPSIRIALYTVSSPNGTTWELADAGGYTISINANTVRDLAGNAVAAASSAATFHVSYVPTVTSATLSADTGTSNTDWLTRTATQTISGTLDSNLVSDLYTNQFVEVSFNNGVTWTRATTYAAGSNAWSTTATLAGSNTFQVRVGGDPLTGGGRAYTTAYTHTFSLDTAAAAPGLALAADTGAADGVTSNGTVNVSGLEAGATWQYSLDGGATWTAGTGTSVTLTGDGAKAITVRQTDVGGNVSTASTALTFTLDTAAPTTTIASKSFSADTGTSASDFITDIAAQTISGTLSAATVAGEIVEVSLDNGATWTTATNTVGQNTWSLAGQTLTGSNTLQVRVTDAAGNNGTALSQAYVLEQAAPAITFSALSFSADTGMSGTDFITATASQTIGATLSAGLGAGDIVWGSLDNGSTWTNITSKVSGTTLTWNGVTLSASGTLQLKVTDASGNDGTVASQAYTLDTAAPTTTISAIDISTDTGTSATDFITNTAAQTITGTLSATLVAGEVLYGSVDGGSTWTDVTNKVTGTAISWDAATLSGSSSIKFKVTDAAADGTVATQAYTLDTTAPTETISSTMTTAGLPTGTITSGDLTRGRTLVLTGTYSDANGVSSVQIYDGATPLVSTTLVAGNWTCIASGLSDGTHSFTAKATDTAGNTFTTAAVTATVDATAPTTTIATKSFSADTGASGVDFITSTAAQTISGTLSAVTVAGEIVEVSLDNGSTWTTATNTVGQNTWSLAGQTLTASNTLQVRVSDAAGNHGTASTQAYVLDSTVPVIGTAAINGTSLVLTYTEAGSGIESGSTLQTAEYVVKVGGSPVTVNSVALDATNKTVTLTLAAAVLSTDTVTVSYTANGTAAQELQDVAGNLAANLTDQAVTNNTSAGPTVTDAKISVTSTPSGTGSTYKIGDTVTATWNNTAATGDNQGGITGVTMNFSQFGGGAAIAAVDDGNGNWTASYTLVSGSIDAANKNVSVTATAATGNTTTADTSNLTVDNQAPTVSDARIAISGATGTGGAFKIGDTVTATWNNTVGGDNNADTISGVTMDFSAFGGGAAVAATNSGGTWTATYTIVSGAIDGTNKNVSVTATDNAGNATTVADTSNATLDNQAPTVSDARIAISGATGTGGAFKIGDTVTATWNNTAGGDNNADTISGVTMDFSAFGGGAAVAATNSGGTWTATYTIVSGAINNATNRNVSVTATDNAGNTTTTADTSNATVDNVAPAITFSGLSFSADTGTSGTDFVTATAAQTIGATLSAGLGAGDIVWGSLDNGATWTNITAKVSGTTLAWNGVTLSGSSTLQLKVTDAAGNDGTVKSQAYALVTTAPTTTIASKSFSADTGTSSTDFITNTAAQTINGTLSAGLAMGEFVEVSLDNGATWTTAANTVGQNTWSLAGQTLTGSNTLQVRVTNAAGLSGTVSTQAYVLDQAAPLATQATATSRLSPYPPSSTFVVTYADTGGGIDVSTIDISDITVTGPGGGQLAVTSAMFYPSIGIAVYTVSSPNGTTWELADAGGYTISINANSVRDRAGNAVAAASSAATFHVSYVPTVTSASLSADTGTSNTDWLTRTATQTISGTLDSNLVSDLYTNQFVEVSLDNGATWTRATTYAAGSNAWSTTATLSGSNTFQARVGGDPLTGGGRLYTTAYTHTFSLDTAAAAPGLALAADTGAADGITSNGTVNVSGLEAGATWQYSLDGGATWIAGTGTSVTLTGDGAKAITVRQTDVAGNVSTASTALALALDTAATAPILALAADTGIADAITSNGTVNVVGLEAGATWQYSLDGGATWTAGTGTSITLTGDGAKSIVVRQMDVSGNVSTASTALVFTLDTAAPITTIATKSFSADTGTSASDFITGTAAQTISGTLSAATAAGEIVEVSLDNGATWTTATNTVGQNTWSLAGPTLTGSNTLQVRVTDAAGNNGTALTQAYVLDQAAPAITFSALSFSADTGTSGTDFITATASQTIGATLSAGLGAGDIVWGSLDNGATWTNITARVSGTTLAWNGVTLSGSSTLQLKVTDAAGNDGTVKSQAYVLDGTVAAPTIALVADTGSSATDGISSSGTVNVSGLEAGATWQYSLDGGAIWTAGTGTSVTLTGDGAKSIVVRQMDVAGNVSTASTALAFTLDTAAPTTTIASKSFSADTGMSASDFVFNSAAQTLSGTLSAPLAADEFVEVSLDNGQTWIAATSTVGQNTWSLAGQTLTGSNSLHVRVTDAAGNKGASSIQAYVLDTVAPTSTLGGLALSVDTGMVGDFRTTVAAQTVGGTLNAPLGAGDTVWGSLDNGVTWTDISNKVMGTSLSWSGVTLSGSNTLLVKVVDSAGNVAMVANQPYVLEALPPVLPPTPPVSLPPPLPPAPPTPPAPTSPIVASVVAPPSLPPSAPPIDVLPVPNLSTGTIPQSNLVVDHGIGNLSVGAGETFTYILPKDVFQSSSSDVQLSFQATQANGAPLPNWLRFNPETGAFSGVAPEGEKSDLRIQVKAVDSKGNEAVTTFTIKSGGAGRENGNQSENGSQRENGNQRENDESRQRQRGAASLSGQGLLSVLGVPGFSLAPVDGIQSEALTDWAAEHQSDVGEAVATEAAQLEADAHAPQLSAQLQREAQRFGQAKDATLRHLAAVEQARQRV